MKEINSNRELWSKICIFIYRYGNVAKRKISIRFVRIFLMIPYLVLDFFIVRGLLNCLIPYQCKIGNGMKIWHPYGIIIHPDVVIGEGVVIRQQVTIGKSHDAGKAPTIGKNVSIGAGAKIIGDITIGDNTIIGANAVVTKSCQANAVLVGVPAKDISTSH